MPNVVGLNVTQATAVLIQSGIVPNDGLVSGSSTPNVGYFATWPVTINWVKNAAVKSGLVITQSPSSGTTNVALNAAVTLTASNYPMGVSSQYTAGGYT